MKWNSWIVAKINRIVAKIKLNSKKKLHFQPIPTIYKEKKYVIYHIFYSAFIEQILDSTSSPLFKV